MYLLWLRDYTFLHYYVHIHFKQNLCLCYIWLEINLFISGNIPVYVNVIFPVSIVLIFEHTYRTRNVNKHVLDYLILLFMGKNYKQK